MTLKRLKAKVQRDRARGMVSRAVDFETRPLAGELREAARRFVASVGPELGIDGRAIVFDKVIKSPLGQHVIFQQTHGGRRVSGGWLKLDVDKQRRIYGITNTFAKIPKAPKAGPAARRRRDAITSEKAAVSAALAAAKVKRTMLRPGACAESVMYPTAAGVVPAWKVLLPVARPPQDLRLYLARVDGALLRKDDVLKQRSARAYVFDPHPLATLDESAVDDGGPIPTTAYREITLDGLEASGYLDGPYCTTAPTRGRLRIRNGRLRARRGQKGFKEAMVYHHIHAVQLYLQELGLEGIPAEPIAVDVSGGRDDNSYYSPITKQLSFGTGGVDDAEDAEIIVHEYGHAIQDALIPGFGPSGEARAMGEGFGDYLAASFFAERKPERLRRLVGSWDATAYSPASPPCLRRLDSNKLYPRDVVGEEHADGEIWSSCLWEIREAIGRRNADLLVLSHHYLLSKESTFVEAAEALIRADQRLTGGAAGPQLRRVFERRGIFRTRRLAGARFDPFVRGKQGDGTVPGSRAYLGCEFLGTQAENQRIMLRLAAIFGGLQRASERRRPLNGLFRVELAGGELNGFEGALAQIDHAFPGKFRYVLLSWAPSTANVAERVSQT